MKVSSNVGGGDVVESKGSRQAHMADFDALPESIRRQLANMAINWNGSDVIGVYRGHGEAVTLAMLKKTEADMQDAYKARVGL